MLLGGEHGHSTAQFFGNASAGSGIQCLGRNQNGEYSAPLPERFHPSCNRGQIALEGSVHLVAGLMEVNGAVMTVAVGAG